jgi:hypothetical protein
MTDKKFNLFPPPCSTDNVAQATKINGYHLFAQGNWPKNGYFRLHLIWDDPDDLPLGYSYYIISWHMEHINFEWLQRQSVNAPIIVLTDLQIYDKQQWPPNVTPIRWMYWHNALDQMKQIFGTKYTKDIKYKASALCSRISQSKLLITTALLEYVNREDLIISLSDKVLNKNVHGWQLTGNLILDELLMIFKNKYLGTVIKIDEFDPDVIYQSSVANPNQVAYQQAAIHFSNESFHYSLMDYGNGAFILPGPFLTEKTFKCLLSGTAFISVGQFDVYRTLVELGMKFDYGLDLSFDEDPGNFTRLLKIIDLIKTLNDYSADDLYAMTRNSSEFNQDLIVSGNFYQTCESINHASLDKILTIIWK